MSSPPSAVVELAKKHGRPALLQVAKWLLDKGRDLWERNLTPAERNEFIRIVALSKGRRRNLTDSEVTRLTKLVGQALFGKDGADLSDLSDILKRLRK